VSEVESRECDLRTTTTTLPRLAAFGEKAPESQRRECIPVPESTQPPWPLPLPGIRSVAIDSIINNNNDDDDDDYSPRSG